MLSTILSYLPIIFLVYGKMRILTNFFTEKEKIIFSYIVLSVSEWSIAYKIFIIKMV